MSMIKMLLKEMDAEAITTHKMLQRIPDDKYDWKPHEKSMTIQELANHVAELQGWISMTLNTDELDFAKFDYKPEQASSTEALLKSFDEKMAKAIADLKNASDAVLMENWTMRNGDTVYFTLPKIAVLRTWCFNHLIHHRAQLGVYLRLNNIRLPQIYGPTADDNM